MCVNQQEKDMSTSSLTPFGGGQRLCPGLDLARLEASIFLHHLVTSFRYVWITLHSHSHLCMQTSHHLACQLVSGPSSFVA